MNASNSLRKNNIQPIGGTDQDTAVGEDKEHQNITIILETNQPLENGNDSRTVLDTDRIPENSFIADHNIKYEVDKKLQNTWFKPLSNTD